MDDYRKEANIQVGKRLREARNSLGRTQAEIAVSLGVSEEHYRKYESGATGLSATPPAGIWPAGNHIKYANIRKAIAFLIQEDSEWGGIYFTIAIRRFNVISNNPG